MAALVAPNGGQMALHWLIQGQDAYNVMGLHLAPGAVVDAAMANEVANVVAASWTASTFATHVSTLSSLEGVGVRDLRQANLPQYDGVFTRKVGADAGEPIPGSTSICVTLRTAMAGKSFRGRVFLPADGISAWDGVAHSYTTTAMNAADNFLTQISQGLAGSAPLGGNVRLAVIGRRKTDPENPLPPVTNIVTQIVARSPLATTQRRRLPKRP